MAERENVVIVGDGPTGLSAALLLAKNQFGVHVLGGNQTPVHKAMLHNYLDKDATPGPRFLSEAREHAQKFGAKILEATADRIELGPPLRVHAGGRAFDADYLVMATGFKADLAQGLLVMEDGLVRVDRSGRTSHERVYAGGALTRGTKTQVATSVGDGAAIAIDILSRAKGTPSHDWDTLKP